MEIAFQVFNKWRVEQPAQRRALYVHSSHYFQEENILYLIGCWDYVLRPSDEKAQGLVDLFISNDSPAEVNVSAKNRTKAMGILGNPIAHMEIVEGGRRQRKKEASKFADTGGYKIGSQKGKAGNYNLMVHAIEATLPECMGKVDGTGSPPLSTLVKGGVGGKKPTPSATKIVRLMSQYWGAAVVELGLT